MGYAKPSASRREHTNPLAASPDALKKSRRIKNTVAAFPGGPLRADILVLV